MRPPTERRQCEWGLPESVFCKPRDHRTKTDIIAVVTGTNNN